MLNMSSVDDLTTRARIRDAALRRFGDEGIRATTLRAIATDASVSAALIVHHFGSKQGLVTACIQQAHDLTAATKGEAMGTMDTDQQAQLLVHSEAFHPLLRFLIRLLAEDPDQARGLFSTLLDDIASWLETGQRRGLIRPTDDPQGRALVMLSSSVGQLMMADLISARLGVEPAQAISALGLPTVEFYTYGVLTDSALLDRSRELLGQRPSAWRPDGPPATSFDQEL